MICFGNGSFDGWPAGTSPSGEAATVPERSGPPFDGTAEVVPKNGWFNEASDKTDEIVRQPLVVHWGTVMRTRACPEGLWGR